MKRLLFWLVLPLLAASCGKEEAYRFETWTVASEMVIGSQGEGGLRPGLLVREADDAPWRPFFGSIGGFLYERGWEYRIRVRIEAAEPMADGAARRYALAEVLDKAPVASDVPEGIWPAFRMEVAPALTTFYGKPYLSVRFPDSGLEAWQPWPYTIEGFDYLPGYLYMLHVSTRIETYEEDERPRFRVTYHLDAVEARQTAPPTL